MIRILASAALAAALFAAVPHVVAHDGHVHETQDVTAETAPKITDFRIEKAAEGGFVVTVVTENFNFAPDDVTNLPEGNNGHAHLTINGTDFGMFYEPVFTIDELPFGPHDFKVTLSNLEHLDYAIAGRSISAETTFTVE